MKKPKKHRPTKIVPVAKAGRVAGSAPARSTLGAVERSLVDDILERARLVNAKIEAEVLGLGEYVLRTAFGNDTRQVAQEEAKPNRVWREVLGHAGGTILRMTSKTLSVALRVAAWDKAINDEAFRNLDLGRKELLLPLDDTVRLREAAQHVFAFKLTYRATKSYVRGLRSTKGKATAVRFTPARLAALISGVHQRLGSAEARAAVARAAAKMAPAERRALAREADRAIAELTALKGELG